MYETINSTLLGENIGYLFTYANQVTSGWFGISTIALFFFVTLLTSVGMQLRFSGRIRMETSYLASCFVTIGYATIMQQISGIFNSAYFLFLIFMFAIGVIWVALSPE